MKWMSFEARAHEIEREEQQVKVIACALKARLRMLSLDPERLLALREDLEREALAICIRREQLRRKRWKLRRERMRFRAGHKARSA
jgi:hypothetical protein